MILSFNGESLIDHSILTLKISLKAFGKPSRESVLNKFKLIGMEVKPQEFERAVRLAYLLHDIGKALSWYQENPRHFSYHEILSSKIVIDLIRSIGIDLPDDTIYLIVASVLLHHQAIRDIRTYLEERPEIWEILNKFLSHEPKLRSEDQKDIDIFSFRVAQLVPKVSEKDVKNLVCTGIENLSLNKVRGLVRIITKKFDKSCFLLLPLILVPLQMADSTAASILRPYASPLSRLAKETFRLIDTRCKLVKLFSRST